MSVRKLAHYALFAVGGGIIYLILECFKIKNKVVISIFLGMVCAFLDEFHQLYSKNRGPKLYDVGIDTAGVISGVLFAFWVINFVKKGRKIYDKLQKNNRRKNCKNS